MPADFNWAIGGEAGDGIDSTGKIFAQALSRAGRRLTGRPWYYAVAVLIPLPLRFTLMTGVGTLVGVPISAAQAALIAVTVVCGAALAARYGAGPA